MQTQCPKCETRFRITDAQLKAAEGQVRCSLCHEVFKATTINEDLNSTTAEQNIGLPEINADIEQATDSMPSSEEYQSTETIEQESASLPESDLDVNHDDAPISDNNNIVELGLNGDEDTFSDKDQSTDHSDAQAAETNDEHIDEFSDQLNAQENDSEEIYLNEQDSVSDTDVILDNNTEIEVDDENNQKQHLDLFKDDNNQDSPQIIPDELRHGTASNDTNFGENLAWASGILLLSSILFAQYFWFNRDQFVTSPKFHTLVENVCQDFDCSKITIRDPANLELLTRNVFSHPDEKNALMINVALQNNAQFSQPYPVLQINFSDIRGDAVVARRFTSTEYLIDAEQEKKRLLQPGSSANLNLEIEDPGKQAITYEFNFL